MSGHANLDVVAVPHRLLSVPTSVPDCSDRSLEILRLFPKVFAAKA
jgi:hypothetical protein